jgi:hypothetical protein
VRIEPTSRRHHQLRWQTYRGSPEMLNARLEVVVRFFDDLVRRNDGDTRPGLVVVKSIYILHGIRVFLQAQKNRAY